MNYFTSIICLILIYVLWIFPFADIFEDFIRIKSCPWEECATSNKTKLKLCELKLNEKYDEIY